MVKKLPFERSELPTEDVAPFLVLLPISVLIEVLAVPGNSGLTEGSGSYTYMFFTYRQMGTPNSGCLWMLFAT